MKDINLMEKFELKEYCKELEKKLEFYKMTLEYINKHYQPIDILKDIKDKLLKDK